MLDDDELQRIYQWVDEITLSRPKRNIARDFADGVLMAELVAHYFPRLVEMHNYPAANSYATKIYNWNTLNSRVFKKMGFQLSKDELEALVTCQPQARVRPRFARTQRHACVCLACRRRQPPSHHTGPRVCRSGRREDAEEAARAHGQVLGQARRAAGWR